MEDWRNERKETGRRQNKRERRIESMEESAEERYGR